MKSIFDQKLNLFYDLMKKFKNDYLILILFSSGENIFQIYSKLDDLKKYFNHINLKECTDIFLSNVDLELIININTRIDEGFNFYTYLPKKICNQYTKFDFVRPFEDFQKSSRNISIFSQFSHLINDNPALFIYMITTGEENIYSMDIFEKLLSLHIIEIVNDKVVFSQSGNLFFSKDCRYSREIVVKNINETKNRQYIEDYRSNKPFMFSIDEVSNYIVDKIPNIQSREKFSHTIKKPIDIYVTRKIISFLISYANIDFNFKMNINIYKYGIEFILPSKFEKNSLDKILKEYFFCPTLKELNELIVRDKLNIKISRLDNRIVLSLYYTRSINNFYDDYLDDIDYKILSYANDVNRPFKRIELNNIIDISPRSMQIRILNLVEKGYLKKNGLGKSIEYELIK